MTIYYEETYDFLYFTNGRDDGIFNRLSAYHNMKVDYKGRAYGKFNGVLK